MFLSRVKVEHIRTYHFQAIDVACNYARAESFIRQAAGQGCELAVLPEYHLTSWVPDHPNFLSACRESVLYLSRYQSLAKELSINIVPGTICKPQPRENLSNGDPDTDVEVHNMAHFIAAGTGQICGSYQKKNLWHTERPLLTSSGHDPHVAFDTPLPSKSGRPLRVGMLICWDLAFPEAFRELVIDGAELIIVPSFWHMQDLDEEGLSVNSQSEVIYLTTTPVARAYENTAAIVFINAGGLSQLCMPIQGPIGVMPIEEEKMGVVDIDLDVLRIAENNYKVREDLARDDFHYHKK